jgi:uncharacterized protein YbaP (TraB family)
MGWIPGCCRALLLAVLVGAAATAHADSARHTFWAVKGQYNTVYLLGSVHVLKAGDHQLPPEALRAYAGAGALVMELDLNDESAEGLGGGSFDGMLLPDGQTLSAALGPAAYATLQSHLKPLGLDAEQFSQMQPWFVAMSVEQLELARLGFDPESGVEMQFTRRAQADHKPVIALETAAEQLRIFANLSPEQQRHFLLYCLDDAEDSGKQMDSIVTAWQHGDTAQLERLLGEGFAKFPELFRLLTTDRNRRWLPRIESMLHDRQDYLVIVGALHLVGSDGLVALLGGDGYKVVQQ